MIVLTLSCCLHSLWFAVVKYSGYQFDEASYDKIVVQLRTDDVFVLYPLARPVHIIFQILWMTMKVQLMPISK